MNFYKNLSGEKNYNYLNSLKNLKIIDPSYSIFNLDQKIIEIE
jgi:hypothetical protein